ncbi:hypothetical protein GCM10011410_32350 [Hoyosella rhizosphaerae]|uniref:Uncharacterized protein n=1 Tax=Hoyosella rhizosphaerae TaxID=1755582 RepID=A0A916XJG4_9ACTN|nr:hypothetical protein GCM10011410_32350 [Hoyosella rhizosphaerae]
MPQFLALLFALGFVAACYGAYVGFSGRALHSDYYGKDVPDHVKLDPKRRTEANRSLALWCTVGALLCLPPIALIVTRLMNELDPALTTGQLVFLAFYGCVVATVGSYPLEKIRRLKS